MWSKIGSDTVTREPDEGLKRDVWKDMVDSGCGTVHFYNTFDSDWNIVGSLT
jgi:hypothetical protein